MPSPVRRQMPGRGPRPTDAPTVPPSGGSELLAEREGQSAPLRRREAENGAGAVVLGVSDEDAEAFADLDAFSALAAAIGGLAPVIAAQGLS